ncbi:hypothetical protein E2562_032936 [Oryza meyeriana var. granulata]|uniref:Uncharacterized protein n=1 Tax=Oryza meyeriana var. granulata TaxID=110450 RepID=A0A6G1DRA7_9ORYZ|nr:hypothetical protein E2562_032936 [Oryza meyeriana var. granulata]
MPLPLLLFYHRRYKKITMIVRHGGWRVRRGAHGSMGLLQLPCRHNLLEPGATTGVGGRDSRMASPNGGGRQ